MALIMYAFLLITTDSQWISPSTPLLPTQRYGMAVGSYNQSIFLLDQNNVKIITYNIDQNTFRTTEISELSSVEYLWWSESQYYTSVNQILYIAQPSSLCTYNMATNSFTPAWITYPDGSYSNYYSSSIGYLPCLSSTADTLYVTGGYYQYPSSYSNDVYSVNLLTNKWDTNLPSLNWKRGYHSCIISSTNKLYAISGYNGNTYLTSIEIISIGNIEANSFVTIGSLPSGLRSSRAEEYEGIIYIIGGFYTEVLSGGIVRHSYSQEVHIIDTSNDEISTSSDQLVYDVQGTAAVIVGNIIYAFGGYNRQDYALDTWMYYAIPIHHTTQEPNTTQAPNGTQAPNATQASNATQAPNTSQAPMVSFEETNLGVNDSMSTNSIIGISLGGVAFVVIVLMCIYGFIKQKQSENNAHIKVNTTSELENQQNNSEIKDKNNINFVNDDITVNDFVAILETYNTSNDVDKNKHIDQKEQENKDVIDEKNQDTPSIFTTKIEAEAENDPSISLENENVNLQQHDDDDDDIVNTIDTNVYDGRYNHYDEDDIVAAIDTNEYEQEGETNLHIAAAAVHEVEKYTEVKVWLKNINLTEYQDIFVQNGYEFMDDVVQITNDDDLKEIGITKPGHRKRILKSIQDI